MPTTTALHKWNAVVVQLGEALDHL